MSLRSIVLGAVVIGASAACIAPPPLTPSGPPGPPPVVTTTAVSLTGCAGRTDDVAGTVGNQPQSTAQMLALLATLGGPPTADGVLDVAYASATLSALASAPAGKRVAAVFSLLLGPMVVNPALAEQFQTTFGISTVQLHGIQAQFGTDEVPTDAFTTFDQIGHILDLTNPLSTVTTTLPDYGDDRMPASGALHYKLTSVSYQLTINGSVDSTASIGTLSISCALDDPVGATQVQ